MPRDEEAMRLGAHLRALRSVLDPVYLPPPIVPLRGHIVDTARSQRLFLELQNLSGVTLEGLGLEAILLDAEHREIDVMYATLSDLNIAADPRRVVPVGGFDLDPEKRARSAIITALYAWFSDGTSWDGQLDALEDPRAPALERARARDRFFAPYRRFLLALDGSVQGALS